jgi:diketogulonate reductase-like aldo/keto reductase
MIDVGRNEARDGALWGLLPVGFGCSTLLNKGRGRQEAVRLLETALEAGVVYFDTARMYGNGETESVLGEVIKRDREKVFVATKVGILPPSRSLLTRAAAKSTRGLARVFPAAERYLPEPASSRPQFYAFDRQSMLRSFEASLAALGVDYVDVLLLHECREDDVRRGEVTEVMAELKAQGRVRQFGLATSIQQTERIQIVAPELCNVVQIPAFGSRPVHGDLITHSVFLRPMDRLRARLVAQPELTEVLGVEPADTASLAKILLTRALQRAPGGLALFSSSRPSAIHENVALARRPHRLPARVGALIDQIVGGREKTAVEST